MTSNSCALLPPSMRFWCKLTQSNDVEKKKVSPRRRKASEESTTLYQSQETPEPTPAYPMRRYICSSLGFKLMILASVLFILGVLLVSLRSPLSGIKDRLQAGSPIEVPTKPIPELLLPRDDAFLSLKEVLSQRVRSFGYYRWAHTDAGKRR